MADSDPSRVRPLRNRPTRISQGPGCGDLARLLDDQSSRWSRGDRVLVEDYLKADHDRLDNPDDLLDLIYHEVLIREQNGEVPALDEYLGRFPQFARQLREQFQLHTAIRSSHWPAYNESAARAEAVTHTDTDALPAPAWPALAGYEVLQELGRGGMGDVYLAWQIGLRRRVALKMVLSGAYSRPKDLDRFRSEAQAVARLDHPNLVKIHEVGEQGGRPYFSMEYVEGDSLADALRGTPWTARRAAELTETLARAVQVAHDRCVIHRDLTPANVLLTTDLYEALTGRPPFRATTPLDTLLQVVHDEPVAPRRLQPKLPRDLETICLKCLNKEPGGR